jgi:hypothetical protein
MNRTAGLDRDITVWCRWGLIRAGRQETEHYRKNARGDESEKVLSIHVFVSSDNRFPRSDRFHEENVWLGEACADER